MDKLEVALRFEDTVRKLTKFERESDNFANTPCWLCEVVGLALVVVTKPNAWPILPESARHSQSRPSHCHPSLPKVLFWFCVSSPFPFVFFSLLF